MVIFVEKCSVTLQQAHLITELTTVTAGKYQWCCCGHEDLACEMTIIIAENFDERRPLDGISVMHMHMH